MRHHLKKNFTLIELMVVVAILGILVSLLLPALGKARDKVKSAVCVNNLKQIGIGINSYAVSYNEAMPLPSQFTGMLVDSKLLDAPRKEAFNGSIDVEVTKEQSVFKCPSGLEDRLSTNMLDGQGNFINRDETLRPWRSYEGMHGSTAYVNNKGGIDSWYGVVGSTFDKGGGGAWSMNNWNAWNSTYTWPTIGKIVEPGRSLALHDGSCFLHTWSGAIPGRISPRHNSGKTTNLLFLMGMRPRKTMERLLRVQAIL